MEYLTNAAERIQNGENLKEIVIATLSWLGNRANIDRELLDKLLAISGVLNLIDKDLKTGFIHQDKQRNELEYWTKTTINYLLPDPKSLQFKKNILFVSANPMESIIAQLGDAPLIQAAEEFKDIEESIRYHQMLENMPLDSIFEASFTELSERLNVGDFEIIHFSNHGDEDGIILNKGDGEMEHVTAKQLTGLLNLTDEKNSFQLMFLNSCNSQLLAQSIHKEVGGIYLISHNKKVPSDLVREFAAYFYRMLAQNFSNKATDKPYTEAFAFALNKFPILQGVSTIIEPTNPAR